jgi:hypothetical protein
VARGGLIGSGCFGEAVAMVKLWQWFRPDRLPGAMVKLWQGFRPDRFPDAMVKLWQW